MMMACSSQNRFTKTFQKWFSDTKPKTLFTRRLSLFDHDGKLRGAWAGKMIGASYAAPYSFRYHGKIMDDPIRPWNSQFLVESLKQTDLTVQMTFLNALERKGLSINSQECADFFVKSTYPLNHAPAAARQNLRAGILPPESGHPQYNPHADDLGFQTSADLFGLICPGMPYTAVKLAENFGRMMNYGDGVYGGLFITGMYSAAYFESDRAAVIEQGLQCIPHNSLYAILISDVLDFYQENPSDWRACWQMLEAEWAYMDFCPDGFEQPANFDAKLNGGYVALGLLYGEGDFAKTLEITTRCGQACGSNTATAAGILGTILGHSRIPTEFKAGIPIVADRSFAYSKYNFHDLIKSCKQQTDLIVKRYAGSIQRLGDREYYTVPVQPPTPPKTSQQFTEAMYMQYRDGWNSLEQSRLEKIQGILDDEFAGWSQGWTLSQCSLESNPGVQETYHDRYDVFVTDPLNRETPCQLSWKGTIPEGKPELRLIVTCSDYHPDADWILRVSVGGQPFDPKTVARLGGQIAWQEFRYDLSAYAGQETTILLENVPNDWNAETAYWGKIEIVH